MLVSSKTIDALRTVGLNKYERNLWVALLSKGSATAGDLADISKVPRSRCYDVLESLATRGFVIMQPGKPLKYVAINPREALERAQKKVTQEAQEISERIDRLSKSESMKELERIHKENIKTMRPEDMTGALKGRHSMHQQFESMVKKSKKSVKLLTTEAGLQELLEMHHGLLKKAAERGVKIQIAAPMNKKLVDDAKNLGKYAQIRSLDDSEDTQKLAGRLALIDGEELLLGLTDDAKTHQTQDLTFWTQSSHASSKVVEPMFDLMWKNAKTISK